MKKFVTGALLGGLGALAAWRAMDEKKRRALQERLQKKVRDGEDYLTEYALTSLDALDGMVSDYGPVAAEKLRGLKSSVQDQLKFGDDQLDRKTFDQQTADLREALKAAKDDDEKGQDIVIDQTTDAAQEPEGTDGGQQPGPEVQPEVATKSGVDEKDEKKVANKKTTKK